MPFFLLFWHFYGTFYGKNHAYVSEIFDYGHSSRQIHFTAVDSDVITLPMGFQLLKLAENDHFCDFFCCFEHFWDSKKKPIYRGFFDLNLFLAELTLFLRQAASLLYGPGVSTQN